MRVRGKGNKERVVWLTVSLWETLQAWLKVCPSFETNDLFINQRGHPISINGIQYYLTQHHQAAGMNVSSLQLRHIFARRLAENDLPVDSLAKWLGPSRLRKNQRYIDGADPTMRADFRSP